jgi:excisionase family DNA binding protein
MADGPERLEARVRAGEWLRPGDAARLLGFSRSTMLRRIDDGTVGYRMHAGGHQRRVNPEDVLRLLEASRAEHRSEMTAKEETPEAS